MSSQKAKATQKATASNSSNDLFADTTLTADSDLFGDSTLTANSATSTSEVATAFSAPPRIPNVFSAMPKRQKKTKKMSSSKVKKWFRKQRRKHMAALTEEQKSRMKQNMLRQNREQKKHRLGRKAKKMAYASTMSRNLFHSAMDTYTPMFQQTNSFAAQKETRALTMSAMSNVQSIQAARLSESESEDDILDMDMQSATIAASVVETKAEKLLQQLKKEPDNDEERAEKFKVYEQYLGIVTKSRDECVKFHRACVVDLKEYPNVIAKMAKAMKSIDSDSNISINWDMLGGRWFVFDMTRKSDQNNTFIGRVFNALKRDLDMIQDNDMDCPICLENLTTCPSGVRVLHCCHKLCGECYDNWKAACQGGRVICPLCRQQDFHAAVVTRTPMMVQNYLHEMHSASEESESDGAASDDDGDDDDDATAPVNASANTVKATGVANEVPQLPQVPPPAAEVQTVVQPEVQTEMVPFSDEEDSDSS